jgi:hypothetical protein
MATAQRKQASAAEYRRLFVTPQQSSSTPASWADESPEFADGLAEAVEKLDVATQEGWSLVSVSVEKDAKGRRWLNALLKKPLLAEGQQPVVEVCSDAPPLSIFRAA